MISGLLHSRSHSSAKDMAKSQTVIENTCMSIPASSLFPEASEGQQSCCTPDGTGVGFFHTLDAHYLFQMAESLIVFVQSIYRFLEIEKKVFLSISERQKILSNFLLWQLCTEGEIRHHILHIIYIIDIFYFPAVLEEWKFFPGVRKVLGLCRERWCWVLLNF